MFVIDEDDNEAAVYYKHSFLRKNYIVVIIINNSNWYHLFSATCEVKSIISFDLYNNPVTILPRGNQRLEPLSTLLLSGTAKISTQDY